MNILVVYNNKEYKYIDVGGYTTWVDSNSQIVPTMFHGKLREIAIKNGEDASKFICLNIVKLEDIEIKKSAPASADSKVKKSKISLTNVINPFQTQES